MGSGLWDFCVTFSGVLFIFSVGKLYDHAEVEGEI